MRVTGARPKLSSVLPGLSCHSLAFPFHYLAGVIFLALEET
jgi:hypothetical protein